MDRSLYDDDHEAYRETVRHYLEREVVPHYEQWEADQGVSRDAWRAAGKQGVIGLAVPEELGGAGQDDVRYRMVVTEEIARTATTSVGAGFSVQDDIVRPYLQDLGTPEQRQRWLPGMAAGELIGAIAITEPDAGSDMRGIRTRAVRAGDGWLLNGSKTFISNGVSADLVVVVAVTDPGAGSRGFTLLVVERGMTGFERSAPLRKIGLHGQDTAELTFTEVQVPAENVLGAPGAAMRLLMERLPRERFAIAAAAMAATRSAFDWTRTYVFEREAFGKPIGDLQHIRFVLAEIATEIDVTQAYVDAATLALNGGRLTAVDAAKAKWWATELQKRTVDRCLQLFGGWGYMLEYPIARSYLDTRIQTIFGGTTEIMKEIIGRDIAAAAR